MPQRIPRRANPAEPPSGQREGHSAYEASAETKARRSIRFETRDTSEVLILALIKLSLRTRDGGVGDRG